MWIWIVIGVIAFFLLLFVLEDINNTLWTRLLYGNGEQTHIFEDKKESFEG